ncbi:MAG: hypothetical protein AAF495_08105 [Pseudomonadota bacterium]
MAVQPLQMLIDYLTGQHKEATGQDYDAASYHAPEAVPEGVKDTVHHLKVAHAEQRQLEIVRNLLSFEQAASPLAIPEDQMHLIEEFTELEREAKKWRGD